MTASAANDIDRARLEDARALAQQAGARVRDDLAVVRVRGDDRLSWLNGQITNDVRGLQPQQSLHALAINVRGKIMGELRVVDRGEHFLLTLAKSAREVVLQSFERYVIMEDVSLERDEATAIVSLQGPRAEALVAGLPELAERWFRADELGHGGVFIETEPADAAALVALLVRAGAREVGEAGFELARLRAGRPRFGVDYGEAHYPQEAGLDALLSFQKGCYLGQEVVCTLENRGRMHRQLCVLVAADANAALAPAALEAAPEVSVGALTSATFDPESGQAIALGYVKTANVSAGTLLHAGATTWRVERAVE